MAAVPAAIRNRLQAAADAGEEARPVGNGPSLWVGFPRVRLTNADGTWTDAGRAWHEMTGQNLVRYQNVQTHRSGRQFVQENGRRTYLTSRDPEVPGRFVPTVAGRPHFHYQVHWIIKVPVVGEVRLRNGDTRRFFGDHAGNPLTLPLDETTVLQDIGQVRDERPDADQRAFIEEAFARWISLQPQVGGEVLLSEFTQSDVRFYYNPTQPLTFDQKTERYLAGTPPRTEVILNRPLRGIPEPPLEMIGKHLLIPEAWVDYDGQCVANQLSVGLLHTKETGKSSKGNRTKTKCSQYEIESLERLMDEVFHYLYPGQGPTLLPPRFPLTAFQRSILEPFVEGWRAKMKYGVPYTLQELTKGRASCNMNRNHPGFAEALRDAFTNTSVAERYRRFFQCYFNVKDDVVMVPYRMELQDESRDEPRDEPYATQTWRDIGPNSRMVAELVRRLGRPIRVYYNRDCIWERKPEGWDDLSDRQKEDLPYFVWNVWGDHMFAYKQGAGESLQHKMTRPKELPLVKLQMNAAMLCRERLRFGDMTPWSPAAFVKAFCERIPTVFCADTMKEVIQFIGRDYTAMPHYRDSDTIDRLTVDIGGKQRIVIRRGPKDAELLQRLCGHLEDITGLEVPYYGEFAASVAARFVEQFVAIRRIKFDDTTRQALASRQLHLCNICGEGLRGPEGELRPCQTNHKRALANGGDNEISNLELLCLMCHNSVTETQVLHGNAPRLCSVFNPETAEIFRQTPKPRQVSWGNGSVSTKLQCLDVVSCRLNALTKRRRDLPVFQFQDHWEPCSGREDHFDFYFVDAGVPWGEDEECDCVDRKKCSRCHGSKVPASRRRMAPYDGPHVYPCDVVDFLLERHIIEQHHITHGIVASRRIEAERLQEAADVMLEAYSRCLVEDAKSAAKVAILSCLGVWSIPEREEWVVLPVTDDGEVGRFDLKTHLPDGTTLCKTRIPVVSSRSYFPLSLIALWNEQILLERARMVLGKFHVKWHGEIVDGILFEATAATLRDIEVEASRVRHVKHKRRLGEPDDGGQVLAFKVELDGNHIPNKPQKLITSSQRAPAAVEWTDLGEDEPGAVVDFLRKSGRYDTQNMLRRELPSDVVGLISEGAGGLSKYDLPSSTFKQLAACPAVNEGGSILGPPGVGKTLMVELLIANIKQLYGEQTIYKISELHTGARLIGGQTCRSLIHRKVYNKMHNVWIIVDEAFQVHLETWARIAEWKMIGAKYIVLGDPNQLLPIGENASAVSPKGRILWHLTNGLHMELTTCRRNKDGGTELFDYYTRLGRNVLNTSRIYLASAVADATAKFPWDGATPHTFFVISHDKRLRINACVDRQYRISRDDGVLVKCGGALNGTTCQPQDMWIYPGMELMGCVRGDKKKVVNGVTYTVRSVDPIVVDMDPVWWRDRGVCGERAPAPAPNEVGIHLTHDEVWRDLRLTYAVNYARIQGRTIAESHVVLLDTNHRHFTLRHLVVALSRVERRQFLHIARPWQERWLMESAPELPAAASADDLEPESPPPPDEE